jgi:hypothetical protein
VSLDGNRSVIALLVIGSIRWFCLFLACDTDFGQPRFLVHNHLGYRQSVAHWEIDVPTGLALDNPYRIFAVLRTKNVAGGGDCSILRECFHGMVWRVDA